ncbi:MAG: heme-copper oxidase subunit III [Deltaproteobacteria bacterium]|nr:heme-copper oxidase subunit III [Deltaproteobacteria bacterium]
MSGQAAAARRAGMLALLTTEASFFASFIVVYLFYVGKSATGPQPAAVLSPPLVDTACLLASSVTIVQAMRALRSGDRGTFNVLLILTILLGAAFLAGTAAEWRDLIVHHGLTIRTNLFGTTFYALVGFHALHVTVGLALLSVVALLGLCGHIGPANAEPVEMLSWYWHFVDVVWVAVFTVVYGVGT